jgi:hypothetical protein
MFTFRVPVLLRLSGAQDAAGAHSSACPWQQFSVRYLSNAFIVRKFTA